MQRSPSARDAVSFDVVSINMKNLFLFAVALSCSCIPACSTDPILDAKGHLPYQWGKVVEPLSDADLRYLEKLCSNRKDRPIVVSEEFATDFLGKLHGPVRESFVDEEFAKEIWVVSGGKFYNFYRLYFNEEGEQCYAQTGFYDDGRFGSSGGGAGKPW